MDAAFDLARVVGTAAACAALTVSRASLYRRRHRSPETARRYPTPPRALSIAERQVVGDVLHSERFVDQAQAQVYATLLDDMPRLVSKGGGNGPDPPTRLRHYIQRSKEGHRSRGRLERRG